MDARLYDLCRRPEDASVWQDRITRQARHPNPMFPIRDREAALALAERRADEMGLEQFVCVDTRDHPSAYLVYARNPMAQSEDGNDCSLMIVETVSPLPVMPPERLRACLVCGHDTPDLTECRSENGAASPKRGRRGAPSAHTVESVAHIARCPACRAATAPLQMEPDGSGVRDAKARAMQAWNRGEVIMARRLVMPPSATERPAKNTGGVQPMAAFDVRPGLLKPLIHHLGPMWTAEGKPTSVRAWLDGLTSRRLVSMHNLIPPGRHWPTATAIFRIWEEEPVLGDLDALDRAWVEAHGTPN